MDLLSQQLREAAGASRPGLRPPAQARARAERGRRRRRAAAGALGGLAAVALVAVMFTGQPRQRGAPAPPAHTATGSPLPTVRTSAPVTSAPAAPPSISRQSTTTTGRTTSTTTGEVTPDGPLGALDPPRSAPEDYIDEPWSNPNVRFGMLNFEHDGTYCIAPGWFYYGASLKKYQERPNLKTDFDYEIGWGNAPSTCYVLNDFTQLYGRELFNPGGDPSEVKALSKAAFVAAFAGRGQTAGEALWPVWFSVEGDGTGGNPLGYLAEQYDPDDRRQSGL